MGQPHFTADAFNVTAEQLAVFNAAFDVLRTANPAADAGSIADALCNSYRDGMDAAALAVATGWDALPQRLHDVAAATVERYCAISAPDELAGSDADGLFDEWLQSQEFGGYSDAERAEIIGRATDLFPDAADMAVAERLAGDAAEVAREASDTVEQFLSAADVDEWDEEGLRNYCEGGDFPGRTGAERRAIIAAAVGLLNAGIGSARAG